MIQIGSNLGITEWGAAAVFVVLGSFAAAGQQGRIAEPPTPAQLMALENIQKLESKIVFDHEDYLPSERAVFTVTIRNPASTPLEVLAPFQTGACYLIFEPDKGGSPGGGPPDDDFGGYFADATAPTMVLRPGQVVEETTVTTPPSAPWWVQFDIPRTPGWWRVVYGYDDRIHADFKVVAPTKLWAVAFLRLRPVEVMDYGAREPTVRRPIVPFMVIETVPGEYWLFRGDPRKDEISPWPVKEELALRELFGQIRFFERVQRLDEPVTSLQTELRADDTADVKVQFASGRAQWLNVPSAPAKKPTPVR
jgi:hypothetical protein